SVLESLSSLVNRSLVLAEEHGDGLRYRMLETVREYALERLRENGEEATARKRHADCFLALAEEARPFLEKQESGWLERADTEHDNLRAALACLTAQEETIEKAARLAVALTEYWNLRMRSYEQRTFLMTLVRRPAPLTETRVALLGQAAEF